MNEPTLKVIKTIFSENQNSIIIELKKDDVKYQYDIRLKLKEMKLMITNFGVKEGKQRRFRYVCFEDLTNYRALNRDGRKLYEANYIKNNIPKEVINLAYKKFVESIDFYSYED